MIDLNKARAARREKSGEGPKVQLGERTFELPAEMPFEAASSFSAMSRLQVDGKVPDENGHEVNELILRTVKALFGPLYEEFMALSPSAEDITALIEGIVEEYGTSPGEAPASAAS